MKRSRLKSKRTKPRPLDDTPLYRRYAEENSCSEFMRWLGITFENRNGKYVRIAGMEGNWLDENKRYADGRRVRLETHHLWSLNRRPDLWSALIRMTDDEHAWAGKNLPAARVCCLAVKLRKLKHQPQSPGEFTLSEIDAAAGKHVLGIVAGYAFTDPLFVKLQGEVVEGLTRLEREAEAA